jgi:hypothetical protein
MSKTKNPKTSPPNANPNKQKASFKKNWFLYLLPALPQAIQLLTELVKKLP